MCYRLYFVCLLCCILVFVELMFVYLLNMCLFVSLLTAEMADKRSRASDFFILKPQPSKLSTNYMNIKQQFAQPPNATQTSFVPKPQSTPTKLSPPRFYGPVDRRPEISGLGIWYRVNGDTISKFHHLSDSNWYTFTIEDLKKHMGYSLASMMFNNQRMPRYGLINSLRGMTTNANPVTLKL